MTNNNLSLRPLPNRVKLFDSPPNRIEFKGKWVMMESKVGFPFHPLIGKKDTWDCVPQKALLSKVEKRFIADMTRDLGSDPHRQTRVYSMSDLLSEGSLAWCSIRVRLDFRKRELSFEPLTLNQSWTIHPGDIFALVCLDLAGVSND